MTWGAAVAGLAGATANIISTNKTNRTNKSIANANNAMALELANTAHQREVEDLKKAGLNPILSAGGNGAVTPALQQAQMQAPQIDMPSILNAVANMQTSNVQAEKTRVETQLAPKIAKAQIELQNAEGNLTKQKQIREKLESDLTQIEKEWIEKHPNLYNIKKTFEAVGGAINAISGLTKAGATAYAGKKINDTFNNKNNRSTKNWNKINWNTPKGDYDHSIPTKYNLGIY